MYTKFTQHSKSYIYQSFKSHNYITFNQNLIASNITKYITMCLTLNKNNIFIPVHSWTQINPNLGDAPQHMLALALTFNSTWSESPHLHTHTWSSICFTICKKLDSDCMWLTTQKTQYLTKLSLKGNQVFTLNWIISFYSEN